METNLINPSKIHTGQSSKERTPMPEFSGVFDRQLSYSVDTDYKEIDPGNLDNKNVSEMDENYIVLGTISKKKPTVSNLLVKHPEYGKQCWKIIHAEQNRNKPYTRIHEGTVVYLNPDTLEIVWGEDSTAPELKANFAKTEGFHMENNSHVIKKRDKFSENLAKAVEPYMGKPYEEVDCYELVVEGLKEMGVQYSGNGGLKQWLIKMATKQGLPYNSYLSGEGIVAASGLSIYSKSFQRIKNPEAQARMVFDEMKPFNKKGFILSFSTRSRGHTGILSRKNNSWTFINSGRMDHNVGGADVIKGVGEERLSDEVLNWFKLAESLKEPLQITLGQLNKEKLTAFLQERPVISEIV